MEKCKTILLVCLIVLMLAAAGVYIGGSQFARAGAADVRTLPPDGTVPVGTDAPATRTLADAGLLVPEAAAVRAGSPTRRRRRLPTLRRATSSFCGCRARCPISCSMP